MKRIAQKLAIAAVIASSATLTWADGHATQTWTLDGSSSKVAFGSIKSNMIGEAHHFSGLSGTVDGDGMATIVIDLATVQTNIDIRNERMTEHVFNGTANATLKAPIDMAALNDLPIGGSTTMLLDGTLELLGNETNIEAPMFVVRITEDRVMATTDEMIFVETEVVGIDEGVNTLMELAGLESITRASPVTLRFMFDADAQGS